MSSFIMIDEAHEWPDPASLADVASRRARTTTTYVGAGGTIREIATPFDLGYGVMRASKRYGIRRAVWDIAYGYVSGFRKRDIAYFVLTRSLSGRVSRRVMQREGVAFVDGVPIADLTHADA